MALLDFGELLSSAIDAYKEHLKVFLQLGLIVYFMPIMILEIVGALFLQQAGTALASDITFEIIKGFLSGIFTLFFTITIIKALTIKRVGNKVTFESVVLQSVKYIGRAILLSIIMMLALFALYLLLIIPGIIFSVFWAFALYALVIDDTGTTHALRHSMKVVKGKWWTVFGYLVLMGLLLGLIGAALIFPFGFFAGLVGGFAGAGPSQNVFILVTIIVAAFSTLINMILLPFNFAFVERFYVNLRDNTPRLYDVEKV